MRLQKLAILSSIQSCANALRADRRPNTTVRTAGWEIRRSSRQARDVNEAPTPAAQRLKSIRRFSAHSLTIRALIEVHSSRVWRVAFVASEMARRPSPDGPSMSEVKTRTSGVNDEADQEKVTTSGRISPSMHRSTRG